MLPRNLPHLDAKALQHGDEQIGHRRVVLRVKGEVLTVFEPAAGEDEREVLIGVGVGVAEAASAEDLRVIEQGAAGLADLAEGLWKAAKGCHLGFLDPAQLRDLFRLVAVVGEAVGFVLHAGDARHHGEGAERERDHAGAVCLQGEADEVKHEI